jgi:hypothetical protein
MRRCEVSAKEDIEKLEQRVHHVEFEQKSFNAAVASLKTSATWARVIVILFVSTLLGAGWGGTSTYFAQRELRTMVAQHVESHGTKLAPRLIEIHALARRNRDVIFELKGDDKALKVRIDRIDRELSGQAKRIEAVAASRQTRRR